MSETLVIKKKNESYLHIETDISVQMELSDHFCFQVDGYQFMPAYKAGRWDGNIRLFDLKNKTIYAGIYDQVVEFAKARDYQIDLKASPMYGIPGEVENISIEEIKDFCESLDIHSRGKKIEIRDYQFNAIYQSLLNRRLSVISPTGSGKSLIIYCIIRYLLAKDIRILLMVPTVGLTTQMLADFKDYSSESDFDVDENVHLISAGKEKNTDKNCIISTWQILQKEKIQSFNWYKTIGAILCDELQTARGNEIQKIMENATDVAYRLGFTGTLDKIKVNKLIITGLFGSVYRVSTTKQLMEAGHLSDLKIKCIVLDYSKETKKLFRGKIEYHDEIKFIVNHDRRNKFIRNLALSVEGNTLILFNFIEHGEKLFELIKSKSGDRTVELIHGGVDSDEREEIRQLMVSSKNVIAVASYGTTSTGINIPNIENIIFASPYKSMIRILQSVGRGLRNAENKTHCNLFDISDKISGSKSKPNYSYNHLVERLKIYSEENFEYQLVNVNIEG